LTVGNKYAFLKVYRFDPERDKTPHYVLYQIPLNDEKINLLQALEYIYQKIDAHLAFHRFCCGLQFCNSCLLEINGKLSHACLTILEAEEEIEIAPPKGRKVIKDLLWED